MKAKSCFGILFGLSIVAGIIFGNMIKGILYPPIQETPGTLESLPTTEPNPERNDTILFIGVDHLDAKIPFLEGAYLATLCNQPDHDENTIHIILITLYPIIPEHENESEKSYLTKPHNPIPIDINNLAGLDKIYPISSNDETWSHVIVIDEEAMNLIISLINPNMDKPPKLSSDTFIKAWENPEGAYQQHQAILTTLCDEPDMYAEYETIRDIVELNNTHLKTNLSGENLIRLWQLVNFSSGKSVRCEFFP